MFTGIVEERGRVAAAGARLTIECRRVLEDLTIGGSIAVNGVCLTAVEVSESGFTANLAPETLDRSNLGDLRVGDPVNLERPVTLATRLSVYSSSSSSSASIVLRPETTSSMRETSPSRVFWTPVFSFSRSVGSCSTVPKSV